MADINKLEKVASQVRRDIIRMVGGAKSGHPGGSLGCTDVITALYFDCMKYDAKNFTMEGKNEDMFFLSNGHVAPAWYSVLAHAGFFEVKELATLRKVNSRLQGHPTPAEHLPGVRIASGSLGQGMSVAIGAALAKKLNKDTHLVFSLHGDGELQEGQIWEATMFAAGKKVDNLVSIIDYNGQQIDGPISEVMPLGNLKAKFLAFDWDVLEMHGNDMHNVVAVLNQARQLSGKGKPIAILMKSEMGYGVDYMMGTHKWHGKAPNADEIAKALAQLPETLGDY